MIETETEKEKAITAPYKKLQQLYEFRRLIENNKREDCGFRFHIMQNVWVYDITDKGTESRLTAFIVAEVKILEETLGLNSEAKP